jgi:predicted RNA-binding protein YlxR (DUF448 family)
VAKKTAKRVKHVPQRTCVGCRETLAKRGMIRIARTPEGLRVDPTGKVPGRGAYLHDRKSCWERGLKGALAHALKIEISDTDRDLLKHFMHTLPDEEEAVLEPADPGQAPLPEETQTDAGQKKLGSLGNAI